MNFSMENNIIKNKSIETNARKALNQYKLEIGSELNNFSSDQFPMSYFGNLDARKLVEIGEKELLKQYNNKK